ncbi:hypothetical protein [Nonomuraea cypriaca]|uniref:hypothetical protein n=1 Tax=Nonomuraea cypriaca TaxID=1187855 RepID=UPI001F37CE3E|nr:hypothetical protein [Nonomuraea cypriaca]
MQNVYDYVGPVPWYAPWATGIAALVLVAAGIYLRRLLKRRPLEDVLTIVAASIATGVSAQGMWRFSGDVLGLDGPLRLLLFAFIEVAIITSAVRARRNMRENYAAGIDGIAVWALTVLTAVLSSMDAHSLPEAVFRLAAPLVAAWLWERGMAIERHRIRGTGRINWRLTPERVLVRLGLAEATDRTAGEVDAHRRITRVALAAKRVHQLQEAGASARKMRAAVAKRDRMLDQAVAHTGLARDETMQAALLDMVTTLGGGDSLTQLLDTADAPWQHLDHPAIARPELPAVEPCTAPVRQRLILRTRPRTEEAQPARLAKVIEFRPAPRMEPVRVVRTVRRVHTFRPGAHTRPVQPPVSPAPGPADREAFVQELREEILAAASRGDRWGPDYEALIGRARRSRSWVEKRVREARTAVFRADARTEVAA